MFLRKETFLLRSSRQPSSLGRKRSKRLFKPCLGAVWYFIANFAARTKKGANEDAETDNKTGQGGLAACSGCSHTLVDVPWAAVGAVALCAHRRDVVDLDAPEHAVRHSGTGAARCTMAAGDAPHGRASPPAHVCQCRVSQLCQQSGGTSCGRSAALRCAPAV